MPFLKTISIVCLSLLPVANAGAATSTVAHQKAPVVVSSHPASVRHRLSPFAPILALPLPVQRVFECIMWDESRSTLTHPNLKDDNANGGSSGVFQIIAPTWDWWAPKVGVHVHVWQANYAQQVKVAVEIYKHDGFYPWTTWRLC